MNQPDNTHDIRLTGCRPTPLAHYLKGLGILRLVSEQRDSNARGYWDREEFVLRSNLDEEELRDFLLTDYVPTPVVSPWNAGSGVKGGSLKEDWSVIDSSDAERLEPLRRVLHASKEVFDRLNIEGKVSSSLKETFIQSCRNRWPDEALAWLDAAVVLTGSGSKFPPLLGTGGNDGRLDFSINYAARLHDLFAADDGHPKPSAPGWLDASLFRTPDAQLNKGDAIGQFFPQAAGGANQTDGFDTDTILNPWDFVLMLEGALMFASAAVKRLGANNGAALSVPFTVRHVGVGGGSTNPGEEDDARNEIWLPLWSRPASADELHALMAEGRAEVDGRPARDGIEFARAVSTLGVDRGIDAFQRVGFQQRNGLAYFATPLNRLSVQRRPQVDLLDDIADWYGRFIGRARGDQTPNAIASAAQQLQRTIFQMSIHDDERRVTETLVALGRCERTLARSHGWTTNNYVRPLQDLSAEWLSTAYDGTAEFRLAASLAAQYGEFPSTSDGSPGWRTLRPHLEPVEQTYGEYRWSDQVGADVVWHTGRPTDLLNDILHRRLLLAQQSSGDGWPERSAVPARLDDVARFIAGQVDGRRIFDLLWGLMAIDWSDVDPGPLPAPDDEPRRPPVFYAMLKLCFSDTLPDQPDDEPIPLVPNIHRLASSDDGTRAAELAWRRLRGSGLAPAVRHLPVQGERARRTAAALLFPVWRDDLGRLARRIMPRDETHAVTPP